MYPDFDTERSKPPRERARRVLVVGAGALGCAALRTLAREAIAISLVDFDDVELSNLQRQVLYTDDDLGRPKVLAAAARLAKDFGARIETHVAKLDAVGGPALVRSADVVIDATDDPPTKFLISRLCDEAGVASVYGGVARTAGQWMLAIPGRSACLACVFPARDETETAAGCAALGILAPVAGVVGAMQAITALEYLAEPERAAAGRLHVYELTGERARHIDFPISETCGCRAARTQISTRGPAARAAFEQRFEETTS